jgi:hypothetical protein
MNFIFCNPQRTSAKGSNKGLLVDCNDDILKQLLTEDTLDSPSTFSSSSSTSSSPSTPVGTMPPYSESVKQESSDESKFTEAKESLSETDKKVKHTGWKVATSILLSSILLSLFSVCVPVQNIAEILTARDFQWASYDQVLLDMKSVFVNGTAHDFAMSLSDVFKWDSHDRAVVDVMKSALFTFSGTLHGLSEKISGDLTLQETKSALVTSSGHVYRVAESLSHRFNDSCDQALQDVSHAYVSFRNSAHILTERLYNGFIDSCDQALQDVSHAYVSFRNSAHILTERLYNEFIDSFDQAVSDMKTVLVTFRGKCDYYYRQTLRNVEFTLFTVSSLVHSVAEYLIIKVQHQWESYDHNDMKHRVVSFSRPVHSIMEFVAIEFHYQWESTVALLANEFHYQWEAIEFHYQWESAVALLVNEFQFQWDAYDQNLLDAKVCYISPAAQKVEVEEDLVGFQISADAIAAEDKKPDLLKSDVEENLPHEEGAGKEFVPLAVDHQVDGNEKDVEEEAEVEVALVTEEDDIIADLAETAQEVEEDQLQARADNNAEEEEEFDTSGATTEEGDIIEDLAETAQEVEEDQLQARADNNAEEEKEFDATAEEADIIEYLAETAPEVEEDQLQAPAENNAEEEEEFDASGATAEEADIIEDLAETAPEVEEDQLQAPDENNAEEEEQFDASGATTEEADIIEDLAETAPEVEEDQLQAPVENNAEEEEEFDASGATTGKDRLKAPAENDEEATEASLTNVYESTEETKEEMELKDPSKPMLRVVLPDLGSHPTFFGLVSTTRESVTLYDGKLRQLKRKIESFDGESLAYQAEVSSIEENEEEENFSTDIEETAAVENEPKRKGLLGQLVNVSKGAFFSAITSFLFSILFR